LKNTLVNIQSDQFFEELRLKPCRRMYEAVQTDEERLVTMAMFVNGWDGLAVTNSAWEHT
jgi:hypothetical protein